MTIPQEELLVEQLRNVKAIVKGTKAMANANVSRFQAGGSNAAQLLGLADSINASIGQLTPYLTNPGALNAYAQANQPGYTQNLSDDITLFINAARACNDWIVANFPKDAGGFLLAERINPDASRVPRVLTPAQLAPLIGLLQTLAAT